MRRRRNGGPWRFHSPSGRVKARVPIGLWHTHWKKVKAHQRRVNPRKRGRRRINRYAAFIKRHRAMFKRLGFKRATKRLALMWKGGRK